MTTKQMRIVAIKLHKLAPEERENASTRAENLFLRVKSKWKRDITAPSNCIPLSVVIVVGENVYTEYTYIYIDRH